MTNEYLIGYYTAATTTICFDPKVKETLSKLKIHPQESYNSVIERLVKMTVDPEPLSEETIKKIEKGLEEIKNSRYYTEEEVFAELGIKWRNREFILRQL